MPGLEFLPVLLLIALAWFWLDSLKVREAAVNMARVVCNAEGVLQGCSAHTALVEVERFEGELPPVTAFELLQFVERGASG